MLITLIYIALELYYYNQISDAYEYMGFVEDLNLYKYLITKLTFGGLLFSSYEMFKRDKFLYTIFLFLLLFFFIPNAILFSFSNGALGPFISNLFFVTVFLLTPYLRFNLPSVKLPQKKKDILVFILPFLLLIPVVLTFKLEINLKTLILKEVYETRDLFSIKMGGMLSYFYHFLVKTIVPIALVYFMIKKKHVLVGVLALVLIYLYVISGNKIVYFTTFIIMFFYYLGSSYTSKASNFFILTLAFLAVTPFIDSFVFEAPVLSGTFVNRFFFIPALLTQWYFEFFDGNPYYFAESSFFNLFVESPYDMPVGYLLTKVYWNEPTVYANNGIVSDGFMNLGYFGVFLFSIFFAFLFSLFSSFKMNKGYFGLFFCYIYIILSAPLLGCLITGGIVLFITLWFLVLNNKVST